MKQYSNPDSKLTQQQARARVAEFRRQGRAWPEIVTLINEAGYLTPKSSKPASVTTLMSLLQNAKQSIRRKKKAYAEARATAPVLKAARKAEPDTLQLVRNILSTHALKAEDRIAMVLLMLAK